MSFQLRAFEEVETEAWLDPLNDERMRRHLVSHNSSTAESCAEFVALKRKHWEDHGFGVWALFRVEKFIGWGGPQRWNEGEFEVGLILHPDSWVEGAAWMTMLLDRTFRELQIDSVLVLLRDSRPRSGAADTRRVRL